MGEINEQLKELTELIREDKAEKKDKKKRKFRLPLRARVGNKKASKGYVGIWKINENGFITASKQIIKEQTIMVDGVPRLATPEYVLRFKKGFRTYPLIILPSSSVKPLKPEDLLPFNPAEHHEKTMEDGSNKKGYQLLMNRMKLDTVGKLKGQVGGLIKWIIGLGLVGIILYAIFTSGGG
ncbi:MAG TPA: hypothetical protein VMZ91_16020 [Candidatus Paceibacterota bacterium]|nr:hypothetical protein [Candidatus Paceibacterota bacterium]